MPDIVSKLKLLLKSEDTTERCGLVLTRGNIVELENKHPDPRQGFAISARDILEYEDKVVGTWHTHPGQTSVLSQDDYLGFMNWPGLTHYIIGTDGVRGYVADDQGILSEVPCI